jgi:hypothetical protein
MSQIRTGAGAPGLANVDANNNLNVVLPLSEVQAGFAAMTSEVDSGVVLGDRLMRAPEVSEDFRTRVGVDTPLFSLSFEGTNVPTALIQQTLSTMTTSQASNFFVLNAGNAVASLNAAQVRTYRTFPLFGSFTLYIDMVLREGNPTATNAISEWGIGYVAGTSPPTDGIFFRRLPGGQLLGVLNFNGTELAENIDTTNVPNRSGSGLYDPTEAQHYLIARQDDQVSFWINDVLVARIKYSSIAPLGVSTAAAPIVARVYNNGAASAGRRIELGLLSATMGDLDLGGKPWPHSMAGAGLSGIQAPPGVAAGQNANYVNSTAPASATLSNTAAGYTTLGGQWQAAAVAGSETDYALFAYQVPAGTAALAGRTFYVTGIRIGETVVQGAAVATTTVFQWALGVGSSAVSLATTDAATTSSPKRVALGSQSIASGAAIGSLAPGFSHNFNTPQPAPSGTFVHIILKVPQGAATPSLVFRGTVMVEGYFE